MFKRNIMSRLEKALSRSPVVFLAGARQSGKTILVEAIATQKGYNFFTLDDIPTYLAAKNDPVNFIAKSPKPMIIDEVQRVPELFLAIKREVDKKRIAGEFLLTGSVNPLAMSTVADSLTGRIETLNLFPLSQGEILGIKEGFIDLVFSDKNLINPKKILDREELYKKVIRGGFPLVQDMNVEDHKAWTSEYIKNIVQKDAKDITNITDPSDLYSFIYALAGRASGLLNVSDVSRNLHISQATLQRYASLLEALFMVYFQRSWNKDIQRQLVKAKKTYLIDSGFLSILLKINLETALENSKLMGEVVENFVALELLKQLGWSNTQAEIYHFRTTTGIEIDILLEDENKNIVGIEVKSRNTISAEDFKGLQYLKEVLGKKFIKGIVLYTGDKVIPFGENLFGVPISALWTI